MTIKINLLPEELSVSKELLRILQVTRMLGVIGLGLFIVFGLALGGFFIFSSYQLSGISTANDSLKNQILAQESTETQIVLLKDRLGKIRTIQSLPNAFKNLDAINSLLTGFSGTTNLDELDVSSAKVSASINFNSNSDLSTFLKALSASTSFKSVTMSSFNFNPSSGYLVAISAAGK